MIDGNSGFVIEREIHVKKVKRLLDNWREIAIVFNSILLWKKNYYPWILGALTSYVFLELAYYSPSFLTSVGLFCFIATLVDFGGPTISAMIWKPEDWTTAKEREFEEICRSIASVIVYIKQCWAYVMELKTTKPTMYFLMTISSSLFLTVIGNTVNNIAILYFFCMSTLMLPGMLHYGILQKYYQIGLAYLMKALRSVNSSVSKTKTQ